MNTSMRRRGAGITLADALSQASGLTVFQVGSAHSRRAYGISPYAYAESAVRIDPRPRTASAAARAKCPRVALRNSGIQ